MADAKSEHYAWFENVRVELAAPLSLECIVYGKRVPLPVALLHPECQLRGDGDTGWLGVPLWWATEHGLVRDPKLWRSELD